MSRWWLLGVVLALGLGAGPGHACGLRGPYSAAAATAEDQLPGEKYSKKERSLQAINTGSSVTVGMTGMTGGSEIGSVQPTAHATVVPPAMVLPIMQTTGT